MTQDKPYTERGIWKPDELLQRDITVVLEATGPLTALDLYAAVKRLRHWWYPVYRTQFYRSIDRMISIGVVEAFFDTETPFMQPTVSRRKYGLRAAARAEFIAKKRATAGKE